MSRVCFPRVGGLLGLAGRRKSPILLPGYAGLRGRGHRREVTPSQQELPRTPRPTLAAPPGWSPRVARGCSSAGLPGSILGFTWRPRETNCWSPRHSGVGSGRLGACFLFNPRPHVEALWAPSLAAWNRALREHEGTPGHRAGPGTTWSRPQRPPCLWGLSLSGSPRQFTRYSASGLTLQV